MFKFAGIANSAREEESVGGLAAFKNVGKATKDGILGTAGTPIHMVATEGGHFKEQLWRTIRTIALAFLLMSGVGALIEDRGISKGINYVLLLQVLLHVKNSNEKLSLLVSTFQGLVYMKKYNLAWNLTQNSTM